MRTKIKYFLIAAFMLPAMGIQAQETKMITQEPVYEMTVPIPENITTPDKVETSIGTLDFFDGIPTLETKDVLYDYVDRARAVEAYINMIRLYHCITFAKDHVIWASIIATRFSSGINLPIPRHWF